MTHLTPGPDDRYLILAPHPDDEALSAGGVIQEALAVGARVRVVYLTLGEANGRRETRKREAIGVMGFLGLSEDDLSFLGYRDRGLMQIWKKRARCPENEAVRLLTDLERCLDLYRPTHIFCPSSFDTHPDHRAACLFLMAVMEKRGLGEEVHPHVYLYVIHRLPWLGRFFSGPDQRQRLDFQLTEEQAEKKRKTILFYKSQTASRNNFLLSFAGQIERFEALSYSFSEPANSVVCLDYRSSNNP